jgi:hypothetical protein
MNGNDMVTSCRTRQDSRVLNPSQRLSLAQAHPLITLSLFALEPIIMKALSYPKLAAPRPQPHSEQSAEAILQLHVAAQRG